jgi:hypothetical protein
MAQTTSGARCASARNGQLRSVTAPSAARAGLAVSGWLGGRLAYRYGVRVADEATQVEGYQ